MLGARIGEQSYEVPASHTVGPKKKKKERESERTQDNCFSLKSRRVTKTGTTGKIK